MLQDESQSRQFPVLPSVKYPAAQVQLPTVCPEGREARALQDLQWEAEAPVHVRQFLWQGSQVAALRYLSLAQEVQVVGRAAQVRQLESQPVQRPLMRILGAVQEVQVVEAREQVRQLESQERHSPVVVRYLVEAQVQVLEERVAEGWQEEHWVEEGPEQVAQEGWHGWQVLLTRVFPGEHERQ